jgi:hypothetical protein
MGNESRAIALLALALAFGLFSCSDAAKGKTPAGSEAGKDRAAANAAGAAPSARGPEAPSVGDEVSIPALGLEHDDLVIAYRHAHHAYLDAYGFDTEVFRFRKNGIGTLRAVAVSKRLPDGEETVAAYDFLHVDGTVTLRPLFEGQNSAECILKPEAKALVARGKDFIFSYSAPEPGLLRIEHRHGARTYVEEWRKAEGGSCLVSDSGGEGAKGRFEGDWPRPLRYIERPDTDPSGGSDTAFEFFDLDKELRFRSESAEPIGEGLFLNLAAAIPKGPDLEAVALLDITLGEERRITPLLARCYFGSE